MNKDEIKEAIRAALLLSEFCYTEDECKECIFCRNGDDCLLKEDCMEWQSDYFLQANERFYEGETDE